MSSHPVPLIYDQIDLTLIRHFGARRANTGRLRELIDLTARAAVPILRTRLDAGRPIDGIAWTWRWRRDRGTWTIELDHDAEDPAATVAAVASSRPNRGSGFSAIDSVIALDGPLARAKVLARPHIKISAFDSERRHLAFDHLAEVRDDGSLSRPVPSLPAHWPAAGSA